MTYDHDKERERDERIAMVIVAVMFLALVYGAFWLATGGWE